MSDATTFEIEALKDIPITVDVALNFDDLAIRRIYDYWKSKTVGSKVPTRQAIHADDLDDVEQYLTVGYVNDAFEPLFFDIVGANMKKIFGDIADINLTSILPDPVLTRWALMARTTFEKGAPVRFTGPVLFHGQTGTAYEALIMPLEDKSSLHTTIMIAFGFKQT
jgi:hypothetical protein